jgi:primosomal protein N' (replication factor Y)
MRLAKVLIEHPIIALDLPFDYLIPEAMSPFVGVRVEVEFNKQIIVGYLTAIIEDKRSLLQIENDLGFSLKPIIRVIDDAPILNKELVDLASQLAYATVSPLISIYQAMLPPSLKPTSGKKAKIKLAKFIKVLSSSLDGLTTKQGEALSSLKLNQEYNKADLTIAPGLIKTLINKGKIEEFSKEVYRSTSLKDVKLIEGHKLNPDQAAVLKEIKNSSDQVYLLQGVTGSGKTEIYIDLAIEYLEQGKNVLILVPEISLTPQMVERFKLRLKFPLAVFHSGISSAERYDEYRRIVKGEVRVVIGARSAIFVPLNNLGLIVIDEEHSESYKQDNTPQYHARDVALIRIKTHKAKLILGSATPSLETKARQLKGLYHGLFLPRRINDLALPEVKIVDLMEQTKKGGSDLISPPLKNAINEALAKQQQVILLLNRRGYAPSISCRNCGYVYKCPNCDVALKYHKDKNQLHCHYCDYKSSYPSTCQECNSKYLRYIGFGTQKVEEYINENFAQAKVLRMDLDSVRDAKGYEKILKDFGEQKYNILLGTQMIAKGLDFPNVSLVGVLNADVGLFNGDFRANERVFQLLTQVVGRAGRGVKGNAFIQTFNPTQFAIKLASEQDYEKFYIKEMEYRHERKYPPYRYFALMMFSAKKIDDAEKAALIIKDLINKKQLADVEVLGPSQPYIAMNYGLQRLRLVIKYKDRDMILKLMNELKNYQFDNKRVSISIDIDPYKEI